MQAPSNIRSDAWQRVPRSYAWIVFALTFGLLLSDYMSRQVLNVWTVSRIRVNLAP